MKKYSFLIAAFALQLFFFQKIVAQDNSKFKGQITVGFYNVENLFDAIDDPKIDDAEFLPTSTIGWTEEVYKLKLSNMADVIAKLGDEDGPELLGLVEVENPEVTNALVQQEKLKKHNYKVVQENSKDARGIDVAFAYDPAFFTYIRHKAITPKFTDSTKLTRDFLLVEGKVGGNTLYVIVNHWPSRRGGAAASESFRIEIATQVRATMDSLTKKNKSANIILMGDFNDDPKDKSIANTLKARKMPAKKQFYNPMYNLHESGIGSLPFDGKWNLFDQFILSANLSNAKSKLRYVNNSAAIFSPDWLKVGGDGKSKEYPKRFIFKDKVQPNGHSDHFPIFMQLSVNQ